MSKNVAEQVYEKSYDEATTWLREHQFDVLEAPGTTNRIFMRKYNCSAAIQKNDNDGVKIFVDPKSLLYLNGMVLDYQESLMQSGFVFDNPNAKKACGCGTSFSA